jgi:D-alanyl-D-alanine carboxypeptidase/D-alanyl-D-alanine-endopeptidase (penicillin-binding protein 4)
VSIINKDSQNNHAETMLRRIGRLRGEGSLAHGLAAAREMLDKAGVPREGYDFSDGSGMSTYNRLSPRASIGLLRWASSQPWGEQWYASLPLAGVDGTLKRRFIGTPLQGNLAAKTGTLNATNALSGRFRARTGKLLTFAFFANDVPDGTSAIAAMEQALVRLFETN